jgi:2,2-dialkylglycine decarboxylase (pyruvate)
MDTQWTEAELLDRALRFSFRSRMDKSAVSGPILVWGRGSVVRDVNGKEYLDFNSGQMCAALGHNDPRIVAAIRESCDRLIHSHMSLFNDREILLAARLAEITPPGLGKSMFLGSGSESNEAAMAIARRFTGRYEVASPMASFHGQSYAARAVTFSGWRQGYGPYPPGQYAILAPYRYRCRFCQDRPACDYTCLDASFDLLDTQTDRGLAAVITEPLFSAGGVIDLPPGWLGELKQRCEARGALLIVDEAQTGLAKLGSMWGFEQEGVVPDLFTVSKHFGGGIAISAVVTTAGIEARVAETGLVMGHSHCNDPLPCNAGIASIDVIVEQNLVEVAKRIGAYWRGHLQALAERHPLIGDIRGRGLLQGIELVRDRKTKEPAVEEGRRIARLCLENGLIFSSRRGGSVFRFVPPFTTTEGQMDQAAEILERAIRRVSDGRG